MACEGGATPVSYAAMLLGCSNFQFWNSWLQVLFRAIGPLGRIVQTELRMKLDSSVTTAKLQESSLFKSCREFHQLEDSPFRCRIGLHVPNTSTLLASSPKSRYFRARRLRFLDGQPGRLAEHPHHGEDRPSSLPSRGIPHAQWWMPSMPGLFPLQLTRQLKQCRLVRVAAREHHANGEHILSPA